MSKEDVLAVQRATARKRRERKIDALKELGWYVVAVTSMVATVLMFLFY